MLRGLRQLVWIEVKVFLREPLGAVGTFILPVMAFILLGRMTPGRAAPPSVVSAGVLGIGGVAALVSMLVAIGAVPSLVTIISIYREGGIL